MSFSKAPDLLPEKKNLNLISLSHNQGNHGIVCKQKSPGQAMECISKSSSYLNFNQEMSNVYTFLSP